MAFSRTASARSLRNLAFLNCTLAALKSLCTGFDHGYDFKQTGSTKKPKITYFDKTLQRKKILKKLSKSAAKNWSP